MDKTLGVPVMTWIRQMEWTDQTKIEELIHFQKVTKLFSQYFHKCG